MTSYAYHSTAQISNIAQLEAIQLSEQIKSFRTENDIWANHEDSAYEEDDDIHSMNYFFLEKI